MTLSNLTKKTILTRDLKHAKSFSDQILGLLKKSNPRFLLFYTNAGIHTFGLSDEIDVIVLGDDFKVKKLKKSLKPNSIFFWNPKYNCVIELPKGTIAASKTTLDDKLSF